MAIFSSILVAFVAVASTVSGHGHVKTHEMNGVKYIGYLPIADPDFTADAPSIGQYIYLRHGVFVRLTDWCLVRKIPGDGPIKTPLLANITCNQGAVPIPGRTGAVDAGSPIKFYWNECKSS